MKPSDVCKSCDGVGRVVNKTKEGILRQPWVATCPVCDGIGWDPEAMKQELNASKEALENVKL